MKVAVLILCVCTLEIRHSYKGKWSDISAVVAVGAGLALLWILIEMSAYQVQSLDETMQGQPGNTAQSVS